MRIKSGQILKKHNLSVTSARVSIIEAFGKQKKALSHSDLENVLGSSFDRVTLYRSLSSFEEKGILHRVLDGSSILKYALCHESCDSNSHVHNHIHFECLKCGNSECLNEIEIPRIILPKDYVMKEANVLMQGICANCI